jgi:hypothetical protein
MTFCIKRTAKKNIARNLSNNLTQFLGCYCHHLSHCANSQLPYRFFSSAADCTWDFFTCTRRYGTWPSNKPCCQARFDGCCKFVMGPKKKMMTATTRPLLDVAPPPLSGGYLPPPLPEEPELPPQHAENKEPDSTTTTPATPPRPPQSTPPAYGEDVQLSKF